MNRLIRYTNRKRTFVPNMEVEGAICSLRRVGTAEDIPVSVEALFDFCSKNDPKIEFSLGDTLIFPYTDKVRDVNINYPFTIVDFQNVNKYNEATGEVESKPAAICLAKYANLNEVQFAPTNAIAIVKESIPKDTQYCLPVRDTSYFVNVTFTVDIPAGTLVKYSQENISLGTRFDTERQYTYPTDVSTSDISSFNFTLMFYRNAESVNPFYQYNGNTTNSGTKSENVLDWFQTDFPKNAEQVYSMYGNDSWKYSSVRQYLNSDALAGKWWKSSYNLDTICKEAAVLPAFGAGFDTTFFNLIPKIEVKTVENTYAKKGETQITYDKFILPSVTQMYGVDDPARGIEGEPFKFVKEFTYTTEPYSTTYKIPTNTIRAFYNVDNKDLLCTVHLRSSDKNIMGVNYICQGDKSAASDNTLVQDIYKDYSHKQHYVAPYFALC